MTDPITDAIAAIHASAVKARALELDSRVMFLRRECEATRNVFGEQHYGLAGAAHLAEYHNSAASWRHRRTAILLRARRNHLVGARIAGQLSEAAEVRRGEASMRALDAGLAQMAREHDAGFVGDVRITTGEAA